MTPFEYLPAFVRAFFGLAALLVCLADIAVTVLAAVKKRYKVIVFAVVLFAPVYFIWQVIFDLTLPGDEVSARAVSHALGGLPWISWLSTLLLAAIASGLLLRYVIKYDKSFITPGAIKLFLDKMPCGICCWLDNGKVLFSNICMNDLCVALTGEPLLNGYVFLDFVKDGIHKVDGKVWRFSCRDFASGGETLHEMIASDITTEYAKTASLERDKSELSRINRELNEYTLNIDETVRMQEILQAKVNIHDEMNRLMLSTAAVDAGETAELDRIFSMWDRNALLLCLEAERSADTNAADAFVKLAEALKIRLIQRGELPEALSEEQRALFYTAAQEAVANAAKHAGAKTLEISFYETDGFVECSFTNDGRLSSGEVKFTGGLSNLTALAQKQDVSVTAVGGGSFKLILRFPKKGRKISRSDDDYLNQA